MVALAENHWHHCFQEQEQGPSTEGLPQKAGEALSWPHSHRSQLCTHFTDDKTEPQRGTNLPEGEPGLIRSPSLDSKDRALFSLPCPELVPDTLGPLEAPWGQAEPRGHGHPASGPGGGRET